MGTKGKKIVGPVLDELLVLLSKAFSDEWLAYYQYWLGAKLACGPMRGAVSAELAEHATDELRHAGMIADRILQLGGSLVLEPKEWYAQANCGYDAPADPSVKKLVAQNIKGEQCAIEVYSKLAAFTKEKDIVTFDIVSDILKDEVEHEDDLENLLEDMKLMDK